MNEWLDYMNELWNRYGWSESGSDSLFHTVCTKIEENGCSHSGYVFEFNTHFYYCMKYWRNWWHIPIIQILDSSKSGIQMLHTSPLIVKRNFTSAKYSMYRIRFWFCWSSVMRRRFWLRMHRSRTSKNKILKINHNDGNQDSADNSTPLRYSKNNCWLVNYSCMNYQKGPWAIRLKSESNTNILDKYGDFYT